MFCFLLFSHMFSPEEYIWYIQSREGLDDRMNNNTQYEAGKGDKYRILVRRYFTNCLIETSNFTEKGIGGLAVFTDDEAGKSCQGPALRPDQGAIVHKYNPQFVTPSLLPSTIMCHLKAESLTWGPWIDSSSPDNVCSYTCIFLGFSHKGLRSKIRSQKWLQ